MGVGDVEGRGPTLPQGQDPYQRLCWHAADPL